MTEETSEELKEPDAGAVQEKNRDSLVRLQAVAKRYSIVGGPVEGLENVKAQLEIETLPPEWKAVADKLLALGGRGDVSPRVALENVRAQQEIDALPPEWKAVADKYKGKGYDNKSVLEQVRIAKVQQEIDALPPELKAVATRFLNLSHGPEKSLRQAKAQKEINDILEKYKG